MKVHSVLRKISVIGLISLLALSLTACGNSNKKPNNGVQAGSQQISANKALNEVKNEYQGIANVTYDAKHKSLIFWVNSNAHANKVQSSANKEAHWFTKATHKPDTQAQIRLTGKALHSVQKLSRNHGSSEPPQVIELEQKRHHKKSKKHVNKKRRKTRRGISQARRQLQPTVTANTRRIYPNRPINRPVRRYPIINRR